MQHPFSGILPTNHSNSETTASRRDALKTIAVGAVAVTAISTEALSAAEKTVAEKTAKGASHDRYLVIPSDFTKMSAASRKRLGIEGAFSRLGVGKQKKSGFLAWLNAEQVAKLQKTAGIASVEKISAASVLNSFSSKDHTQLIVTLMPNSWSGSAAPKGSYQSAKEIVKTWKKQFAKHKVTIQEAGTPGPIVINLDKCKNVKAVLAAVKEHRQAAQITGMTVKRGKIRTTDALIPSEMGGRIPNRGGTTLAIGEEGAGRKTTLAMREEGGGGIRIIFPGK